LAVERARGAVGSAIRRHRAFRNGIIVTGAVLVVALWGAVAAVGWRERTEAIAGARRDAANLSLAFEEQISRSLTAIDQAMSFLESDLKREGARFNLPDWVARRPVVGGLAFQLAVIGPDGRLRESSADAHPPPIDFSDREHFRVHLSGNSGSIYISKPVFGRITKRWSVEISRRVDAPDGSLAAVLVLRVDPDYLIRLYEPADLGDAGVITLVGLDGVVRARVTRDASAEQGVLGTSVSRGALFARVLAQESGTEILDSSIDGIKRIWAFRRIEGYPLVVTVGYGFDEVLAAPNAVIRRIILAALVATLALVALTGYLLAEMRRRTQRELELADERAKLEQANRELLASRNAAQAASRAKSEFLANISHELRTPLNAVIGFSELLKSERTADLNHREYASHIHESGLQLLDAINQILELSRSEAGRLEMREEELDIAQVIASSAEPYAARAERSGIALTLALEGPRRLRADEARFRQIVRNLLSNAVAFTPSGGRIRIATAADANGDFLLTISDTGIGMTQAEIEVALEPFRQVDSQLTRRVGGLGLGLPIAKRLVELHGGALGLESAPGRGTTLTVRLPRERVELGRAA
jgi:signal transduction histidine kinase